MNYVLVGLLWLGIAFLAICVIAFFAIPIAGIIYAVS